MSVVPQHVAIIMDGNGRWAQQRCMPRTVGHVKGAAGVRALVENSAKLGIKCLTLFAFSTENWRRPEDEVNALMGLFVQYLEKEIKGLNDAGVKFKVIGDLNAFGFDLRQRIRAAEEVTKNNQDITLCLAANYGGRRDIVQAVKKWAADKLPQAFEDLTEQDFAMHLSTAELPDLDLLIRTGGEKRVSNFLLWQLAYAELYFSDVLWPDFDKKELVKSLEWYAMRMRRFGSTSEQIVNVSIVDTLRSG
jgi:undecaprenyl diphosphate synthase